MIRLQRVSPVEQAFPPQQSSGKVSLHCNSRLARRLFPCLSAQWGRLRLAQVLACTRVVGMECPGLNSVFTGLHLDFNTDGAGVAGDCLTYDPAHFDDRFQLVRLQVQGPDVSGILETFFRPAPTSQIDFHRAMAAARPGEFSGQKALVVGGSRGIGETTAKILAAGGASVCISYNVGHADALAVQQAIKPQGGDCTLMQLDVCGDLGVLASSLRNGEDFNHIYYFATPRIEASKSRGWNDELFASFTRIYLSAFAELVDCVMANRGRGAGPVTFYYPSSIFVSSPHKGFAEYAVAKAAGESLGQQLAKRHKNARFIAPRLPRMATDQTSSIIPIECESTFDVMSRELREMDTPNE